MYIYIYIYVYVYIHIYVYIYIHMLVRWDHPPILGLKIRIIILKPETRNPWMR